MNTAKQEILSRVSRALSDRPAAPAVPRDYQLANTRSGNGLVQLFAERVADYRAQVRRCPPDQVAQEIRRTLANQHARHVVVPTGFPAEWMIEDAVSDDPELQVDELDGLDGVLTLCAIAIADTGTVVLDAGAGQGRRVLTLVPDYHLVMVRAEQIVASVPDAIAHLDPLRPMTWISGPSATSDIELLRVEGVHGPRRLEVLIVERD